MPQLLAQQAPLSTSLSVQNSALCPLTLANGFNPCSSVTQDTYAVDPNLRIGYAQNWQLSVQRDLPAAMQITATYAGIKGTHGAQQILPNTYPIGATRPLPILPGGLRLSNLGRQLHARIGAGAIAAQAAQRVYSIAGLHLFEIN